MEKAVWPFFGGYVAGGYRMSAGLRAGYKQTEVGVIPEDWRLDTVQQFIDEGFIVGHLDGNHGELYPRSDEFKSHGVSYIGANDFANGTVAFNRCKFLAPERADKFRKGVAKDGDVLFAHNATVGPVAILRTTEPFVILSTTATYFRCDSDKLDNLYLNAALQSQHFVRQYQAVMAQSTRFQVPITTQRKLSLVVPPMPEQRAIAAALGEVDALLGGLDRLIAKKQGLKVAAMQQLLTGQTRLPGFSGEWEVKRLGDLGSIYGGLTGKTKADFGEGEARYITFMNVMSNVVIDCEIFDRVKVSPVETQNRAKKGDLFFNGSSETPEEVAMCAVLLKEVQDVYLNSFCFGFRFREGMDANGVFFAYYLRSKEGRELMKSLAQGSTRYNLSKVALLNSSLRLPPASEQTAIATILSDMDSELAALQERRAKTQALKQAMMQELLTGRIRLV
jgi:type I restriction enzyme S subunit